MRSSVVVVSSVNASFNTVGRGVHMDGGESGLYLTNGARPVKVRELSDNPLRSAHDIVGPPENCERTEL